MKLVSEYIGKWLGRFGHFGIGSILFGKSKISIIKGNFFWTRRRAHSQGLPERGILIEQALSDAANVFETRFIGILESLERLEGVSSDLGSKSAELLAKTESADNPVLEVSRSLAPKLVFITESRDRLEEIAIGLVADVDKMKETLSYEQPLDRIFSQLTYLKTLFGIEAAWLDQNQKTMFTALVDEIDRLQKDVVTIFTGNFRSLNDHEKTISMLRLRLEDQARKLTAEAERKEQKMNRAIDGLKSDLEETVRGNGRLKDGCKEIQGAIGEAIVALQTQDIINQKLEHVFNVSKEMRSRFESGWGIRERLKRAEEFRFVEKASVVVSNQIRSIKDELRTAENGIRSNFARIRSSIAGFGEASDLSLTDQNLRSEWEGGELLEALSDAEVLISRTESIARESFAQIEPIRGMATNVTDIIFGLSAQLHLIGLNAEVHAAQMGDRHGLETLSANTSRISLKTRALCRDASKALDSLGEGMNIRVSDFETLCEVAGKTVRELVEEAPAQRESLLGYRSDCVSLESSLSQGIDDLIRMMRSVENDLELGNAMIEELNRMEEYFGRLSIEAKQEADRIKVDVDISKLMEPLLDQYTMRSEKAVHMESLGISIPENTIESPNGWQDGQAVTGSTSVAFLDEESVGSRNSATKGEGTFGENVQLF